MLKSIASKVSGIPVEQILLRKRKNDQKSVVMKMSANKAERKDRRND